MLAIIDAKREKQLLKRERYSRRKGIVLFLIANCSCITECYKSRKFSMINLINFAARMTSDEIQRWEQDGYFLREDVFSPEENDDLRQVAEDIAVGKRKMPMAHIDRNARVRDGKDTRSGIYGMHKIQFPSCYIPEFLARVRDPRLTEPLVDLLGPDILGINNLFI